jgi:hypothetical protein
LVGDGVPGVAAVDLVAREPGVVAEVLLGPEAVTAGVVGPSEPGHPHPVPGREPLGVLTGLCHRAHDLVAGDQGQLGIL